MKKITKTFRLNKFVVDLLEKVKKEIGINSTNLIEIAVIEKCSRMNLYKMEKKDVNKTINEMLEDIEKSINKIK